MVTNVQETLGIIGVVKIRKRNFEKRLDKLTTQARPYHNRIQMSKNVTVAPFTEMYVKYTQILVLML